MAKNIYEENPSILSSLAKRPTATMPQNPPEKSLSFKVKIQTLPYAKAESGFERNQNGNIAVANLAKSVDS